jgi:hypothetical protein
MTTASVIGAPSLGSKHAVDVLVTQATGTAEREAGLTMVKGRAEIPGKVEASAEALTGPTTPAGQRVQTLNPPGSEVAFAGSGPK